MSSQYSAFWCDNCSKRIAGTPYYAYVREGHLRWFGKRQFCDAVCYDQYKRKKEVTG